VDCQNAAKSKEERRKRRSRDAAEASKRHEQPFACKQLRRSEDREIVRFFPQAFLA
jgi:hypothetical protein